MQEQPSILENIFTEARDYAETRANLFRLKGTDRISSVLGLIASGAGLILVLCFFVMMISIGFSLLIGSWLGRSFYGFFIMGGVYAIGALLCYRYRERWMRGPLSDLIIRELLKP
jgi:hypothetical protein